MDDVARLLLAHPRVVILDDATAALDSTSEAAVRAAPSEERKGRTAMVVVHRLSTISRADQTLMSGDGSILERGTHEELLAAAEQSKEPHLIQLALQKKAAADELAADGTMAG